MKTSLPVITCLFLSLAATAASAEPAVSAWADGFNNKARLVASRSPAGGSTEVYAGLEIQMPAGWKTYWRAPGDAGGVPPEFDWKGSDNLAEAQVLYPAPTRLTDKSGDVIGYKDGALFPVALKAKDPTRPIDLKLVATYGVCKDLCVPAEASLSLEIPADAQTYQPIEEALAKVPRKAGDGDPALAAWRVEDAGGKAKLVLEVASGDAETADAFAFVDAATYIPMPKKTGVADGRSVFAIDLTDGVSLGDLKGKPITLTLVDGKGQSETTITLE